MKRYAILRVEESEVRTRGGLPRAFGADAGPPVLTVEQLPDQAVPDLMQDPRTKAITPVMPIQLIRPLTVGEADGGQADNWGIAATGADKSIFNGAGVHVAVLDTGIDAGHPAFKGVELLQKDFTGSGDGDKQGHGTHCAGTIFGRDVDGRIGIARGVTRASIGKVLDNTGGGRSDWLFEAMLWAMRQSADIISMSLGFDFPGMVRDLVHQDWPEDLATSTALESYRGNLRMFDAIMGVLRAQAAFGVSPLVIAAAGNESRREINPDYRIAASLPAAAQGVLSVAALARGSQGLRVADYSNSLAVVSAPGSDILSAWPGGGLKLSSGTSMACPHVAGVAALWWEQIRESGRVANAVTVTARLLTSARTDGLAPGFEEGDVGEGLVMAPPPGG
ncbi:MAG: peptidase [Caulobacter sp.]|jgi:subtilisin family serine protease|nr:peptidase [Caulobacter sp.]